MGVCKACEELEAMISITHYLLLKARKTPGSKIAHAVIAGLRYGRLEDHPLDVVVIVLGRRCVVHIATLAWLVSS
jgi:hypothetical protein